MFTEYQDSRKIIISMSTFGPIFDQKKENLAKKTKFTKMIERISFELRSGHVYRFFFI